MTDLLDFRMLQESASSHATARSFSLVIEGERREAVAFAVSNTPAESPSLSAYFDASAGKLRQGWEAIAEAVPVHRHGWHVRIKTNEGSIMARGATKAKAMDSLSRLIIGHLTEPNW